jgi:hypothetical protein
MFPASASTPLTCTSGSELSWGFLSFLRARAFNGIIQVEQVYTSMSFPGSTCIKYEPNYSYNPFFNLLHR